MIGGTSQVSMRPSCLVGMQQAVPVQIVHLERMLSSVLAEMCNLRVRQHGVSRCFVYCTPFCKHLPENTCHGRSPHVRVTGTMDPMSSGLVAVERIASMLVHCPLCNAPGAHVKASLALGTPSLSTFASSEVVVTVLRVGGFFSVATSHPLHGRASRIACIMDQDARWGPWGRSCMLWAFMQCLTVSGGPPILAGPLDDPCPARHEGRHLSNVEQFLAVLPVGGAAG